MFDPGTGTFINGPKIWIPGTVATPGALETTWSYVFSGGAAGSGSYYVLSRALDAAGNIQTDSPFTRYTVAGVSDTVAPDTSITAPTPGQAVPAGTVGIAGNATDNVGVTSVAVSVRDDGTNLWWNGSAWVGAQQWLAASILAGGRRQAGPSCVARPRVHGVRARSTDAGSNVDGSPHRAFTVLAQDTICPDDHHLVAGEQLVGQPAHRHGRERAATAVRRVGACRSATTPRSCGGTARAGSGRLVRASVARHAGGTSTAWSHPFDPGVAGNYGTQVVRRHQRNVGANNRGGTSPSRCQGRHDRSDRLRFTPTNGQSPPFGSVNDGTSSDATWPRSAYRSEPATSQW
jgi:hypothetical protein